MPTRRILWTGGYDSTWLLVDALLAGHRVEAVTYRSAYIGHKGWHKPANEDAARRRILRTLRSMLGAHYLDAHLGFQVLDDQGHHLPRDVFHEPWYRLHEFSPFNVSRYYLLERTGTTAQDKLDHYGQPFRWEEWKMWADQDWLVGCLPELLPSPSLSSRHSSSPVPLEAAYVAGDSVFKRPWRADVLESLGISLPMRGMSKTRILEDARKRGFAHLLSLTWSCEGREAADGVRAEPCGTCAPCRLRIIGSRGYGSVS